MKKDRLIKFIIVNLLTLTRIIGAIIMPISYFRHGMDTYFLFVALIFFTDFLDGKLSRHWKVESFIGSLLDTVGDKLFALVMIAILSYEYHSMLIVLVLELTISIKSIFDFKNNKNIKSSKMGKVKTFILDASISIMYIYLARSVYENLISVKFSNFLINTQDSVIYILIGINIGMELLTISDYNKKSIKQDLTFESIKGKKLKSKKEILFMFTDREFYIENRDKKLKELLYE